MLVERSSSFRELATFRAPLPEREPQSINVDQKIVTSKELLAELAEDESVTSDITPESFIVGEVPRLSPFDMPLLPEGTRLVRIPDCVVEELAVESSNDRMDWNTPEKFLSRLEVKDKPFVKPVEGNSQVMDRINAEGKIVSFSNLRIKSPAPENGRHSRRRINGALGEHVIMGRARIPFALGSVPDVGSALAYITMAQSNGMVFISRDKILSDDNKQVELVKKVIDCLWKMEIPDRILPCEADLKRFWQIKGLPQEKFNQQVTMAEYIRELRSSWVANVGAAIKASKEGFDQTQRLYYDAGCRSVRVYSPEGGKEIVDQAEKIENELPQDLKIAAGQIIDLNTALAAQEVGSDLLVTGMAGGSQCITSENAGIPVNTPNLLYELRGKVKIPIGVEGGGVGKHIMVAFALGASVLLKPGEIGLSIEGAGGKYMLQDPEGNYWMLYGGEASDASKWWRDLLDKQGRPLFVEGEPGVRMLPKDKYSMTRNINRLMQQTAIGLVFQRASSIAELHQRDCSNIVEVTPEAAQLSGAYGH